ncbi:oligopeptide/dipeptide ABC transporter ATP-binding protein [Arthrobacter sp. AQ5-05]|uniref:oligopeptide/dipeptide ABC transporter ATP-binding protein n=1 Tax=Arthrobacter sp. AQ5-05 TaxID=2184581 RepID=UPI002570B7A7|nr:oligopeptide/dipeptide ABC transporter ATP-binding protein [Arthrobacter sp. AQ5-05]
MVEVGPAAEIYSHPAAPLHPRFDRHHPHPDPVVVRSKAKLGARGELPSAMDPPSCCRFRTRCPMAQEICARVVPPLQPGGGSVALPAAELEAATAAATAAGTVPHLTTCHFPIDGKAAVDVLGGGDAAPPEPE